MDFIVRITDPTAGETHLIGQVVAAPSGGYLLGRAQAEAVASWWAGLPTGRHATTRIALVAPEADSIGLGFEVEGDLVLEAWPAEPDKTTWSTDALPLDGVVIEASYSADHLQLLELLHAAFGSTAVAELAGVLTCEQVHALTDVARATGDELLAHEWAWAHDAYGQPHRCLRHGGTTLSPITAEVPAGAIR